MATEWGGSETGGNAADPGPVNRLELPQGSGWPSRLGGYAKTVAGLIGSLGAGGVLAWLETAGVTHLPGWAEASITAGVGLLAVLFGPRNKP
jgi:hypothetical protein